MAVQVRRAEEVWSGQLGALGTSDLGAPLDGCPVLTLAGTVEPE